MEKPIASMKADATVMWDIMQHGQVEDPVFEGIVRDFTQFDNTLRMVFQGVDKLMMGVESLSEGMKYLSEVLVSTLTKNSDNAIASDMCRYREAVNKITRMDAPHSCIAKLRRDLEYNIVMPLQSHINNNRDIKNSISLRRKRLHEVRAQQRKIKNLVAQESAKLNGAQSGRGKGAGAQTTVETAADVDSAANSALTEGVGRFPPKVLRELRGLEASLEYSKTHFREVDRPLFEWMMMLETYRLDIYDSMLQTVKYLQCEFLNESKEAMAHSIPEMMKFRPMIEMTPEQMKVLVDQELRSYDPQDMSFDLTANILKKWERDGTFEDVEDTVEIDQMSLATLTAQGFEEELATKALRVHSNDTQAALDMLLNNLDVLERMDDAQLMGGRTPTSRKWERRKQLMRERAEKGQDDDEDAEALTEEYKKLAKERVLQKKKKATQERKAAAKRASDAAAAAAVDDDQNTRADKVPDSSESSQSKDDDVIGGDDDEPASKTNQQPNATPNDNASGGDIDLFSWNDTDTTATNNTTPSKAADAVNNNPLPSANSNLLDATFDVNAQNDALLNKSGIGDFASLSKESSKLTTLSDLFGPTPQQNQAMPQPTANNSTSNIGLQSNAFRSFYWNPDNNALPQQPTNNPPYNNFQMQYNGLQPQNVPINQQPPQMSPFSASMGLMGNNNPNPPPFAPNFPLNDKPLTNTQLTNLPGRNMPPANTFSADPFGDLVKLPTTNSYATPFTHLDQNFNNLVSNNNPQNRMPNPRINM